MIAGMSILSFDMLLSLSFSVALSGEPGAYDFTGSFTGVGTRRFPLKPEITLGAGDLDSVDVTRSGCFSGAGGRIVAVIFKVLLRRGFLSKDTTENVS